MGTPIPASTPIITTTISALATGEVILTGSAPVFAPDSGGVGGYWFQIKNPTGQLAPNEPTRVAFDDFEYLPEPSSLALLALGGLAMAGRRRRN